MNGSLVVGTTRARRVAVAVVVSMAVAVGVLTQPPPPAAAAPLPAPANAIIECDRTGTWSTDPELGPVLTPGGVELGVVNDPVCDALRRMEDQAVTQVMTLRGLSGSRDLARVAARDDITALLWLGVEQAIRKPDAERSGDERLIVGWLEKVWSRHALEAANGASREFNRFNQKLADGRPGACVYTPPAPYEREYPGGDDGDGVRWPGCFQRKGSLGNFFTGDGPRVPFLEDFVRWGAIDANNSLAAGYPQTVKLSAAAIGIISGVSAGVVAGGGLLFAGTGGTNSTRLKVYNKLVPLAKEKGAMADLKVEVKDPDPNLTRNLDPKGAKAITRTMRLVRAATSFLRALPLLDIIITAIDIAVTRAIELFVINNPSANVGAQISQLRTDAARTPDLNAVLDDSGRSLVLVQLFTSSLTGELGDPPPLLPTVDDPQFRATDTLGATSLPTTTVQLLDWAGKPMTVQLIGGYFVTTAASGEVTTSTQLTALDGLGRPVTASLLRKDNAYQWVLVPDGAVDAACITATDIRCPVTPLAAFKTSATGGAFFEVTTEQTAGLQVSGPLTAIQNDGQASYTVTGTDAQGNPVALTDVRWQLDRELRPERDWLGRSVDPCATAADGRASVWARTAECTETGTGTSFRPTFSAWGTWRMVVTAKGPNGVLLRRVLSIEVANVQPAVVAFPCPAPDGLFGLVTCSTTTAAEGSEIVLRALVVDGPNDRVTLTASIGGTTLGSTPLPCVPTGETPLVSDSPVITLSFSINGLIDASTPCTPGVQVTELTDAGRRNGTYQVEWRIKRDEPLSGPIQLVGLNDDSNAVASPTPVLGDGGWTNVPPVANVAFYIPFFEPKVTRGSTITVTGTVTDAFTPSITAVSATMGGQPTALPTLTPRPPCPPGQFGPICDRPTGIYDFTWSGIAPRSRTGAVEDLLVEFTFADAQGGTATTGKTFQLAAINDQSPPTYTINAVPAGGWYGPSALPVITAVDDDSDIASAIGCGPGGNNVSGFTGTITVTCTASSRGGTSTGSFSVKVDHTPPVLMISSGIRDGDVFDISDVPSGGTCSARDDHAGVGSGGCLLTGYSDEPGTHTLTYTATDRVGNQATVIRRYTVEGTPQFVPISSPPSFVGTPGAADWFISDVTVSYPPPTVADGITLLQTTGCGTTTVTTDGGTFIQCEYQYRINGDERVLTIGPSFLLRRDATPPTITVTGGPQANATYPHTNVPRPARCLASDATSGLLRCDTGGWSDAIGEHVLRYTAIDRAGNVRNLEVPYTVVDGTAPGMTFGSLPGEFRGDPDSSWMNVPQEVYFLIWDDESPVTSTVGCDRVPLLETPPQGRSFTCSATSGGGTRTETLTLFVDLTPPTVEIQGGPVDNGLYAVADLPAEPTCTTSDTLSGPSVTGCTVSGYSTEVGTHELTFTGRDAAANETVRTRTYRVVAEPDSTPPEISAAVRTATDVETVEGWVLGDLTLLWTVNDDGSLVSATNGCDPVDITTDTGPDGRTLTCAATSAGGQRSQSATVFRDTTGPLISLLGGPVAGQSYLPSALPSLPLCRISDVASGVASPTDCTVTGYSTAVGTHTMTATASDVVGNASTRTVTYTVLPDPTPPSVAGAATGTAGTGGWFTGDVEVNFDVADDESPILLQFDCDPVTVGEDTAGTDLTCEAASYGGAASATVTVKRDTTGPTLTITGGPENGGSYPPADLPGEPQCTADDALSGVTSASCTVTGYETSLGAHTITARATDQAGNVTVQEIRYSVTDGSAPVVTPDVAGTLGGGDWYVGDVTVTWTVEDSDSPILDTNGCDPTTITEDTPGRDVTCTATSDGGVTATTVTVKRDTTGPTVTVTGGPQNGVTYGFGSVPVVGTCSASDALSGVDGACTASGWSDGVGTHTITYQADDVAGNTGTRTVAYTVAAGVPGPVTGLTATPGDRAAVVTWTAPANTGGEAPSYVVTARTSGRPAVTATVTETTATLTDLIAGRVWNITVVARTSGGSGPAATAAVVPNAAPTLSGSAGSGRVGQAYTARYTTTGYPAPVISLVGGALPPGLTLSAGRITGTPTAAGIFTFTLEAGNSVGQPARLDQTVTVNAGRPATIVALGGGGQTTGVGQPFASPLSVQVTDLSGNPVAGVTVTFRVAEGPALFSRAATATATTGSDGVATAPTLTATAGGTVRVTATTAGVSPTAFGLAVVPASSAGADVEVTVSAPEVVAPGSAYLAIVTVRNNGPDTATSVRTIVSLDRGMTLQSASGPSASAVRNYLDGGPIRLASGATATYRLRIVAGSSALTGLTGNLTATVVSTIPDPAPATNVATAAVRIG